MQPEPTQAETCNVAAALTAQAAQRPGAIAIHFPTGVRSGRVAYDSMTYAELDEISTVYARGLSEYDIVRGTRTVLMVPPGPEFFALFFALFKAGAVPVLIDPGIGPGSIRQCLAEARPQAFIGVARAQIARMLLRWTPDSIARTVTVGMRPGWRGLNLRQLGQLGARASGPVIAPTRPGEPAAILFTSGSTGPPKGVLYRHRHFRNQVDMLRNAFGIEPGEVDLATFPPFALFDPALGMTTVVPFMDPTRPARAQPKYLLQAIDQFGVTSIFGSPALLNVLSRYTKKLDRKLHPVRRVVSAGAAVPIATVRRMQAALPENGVVHTAYGATECLPVASISSRELGAEVAQQTAKGAGVCVGRPLAPNRVMIVSIADTHMVHFDEDQGLPPGEIGEIAVHGPTVTDAYWRREEETRLSKFTDSAGRLWHRMGDAGYLDEDGRLWYCGRKSQRVEVDGATLFPDQVEAVFNAHPGVERTALVGVRRADSTQAILIAELPGKSRKSEKSRIRSELLGMAADRPGLAAIREVLFHPGFPVDVRHNSKIGRERLARWAAERLR